jgi:hypothetical protein
MFIIYHDKYSVMINYKHFYLLLKTTTSLIINMETKSYTDIAQPITIYTTNRINNLAITDEDIKRIINEKYTKDHLLQGQKGAARFTNNYVLNNSCGPIGNGKYKISESETIIDNDMMGLSDKIMPSMQKKAAIIYRDDFFNEDIQNGYNDLILDDTSIFREELTRLCLSNKLFVYRHQLIQNPVSDALLVVED